MPLEIGLGRLSLAMPLAALLVVLAVAHRRDTTSGTTVRVALVLVAGWALIRLVPLATAYGESVDATFVVGDIGALIAGLAAFHLGSQANLRPALLRGLRVAFLVVVALTAYQLMGGFTRLQTLGYTFENGFHYYTFSGDVRPFGLFTGPTTFGTFAAMLGMFLALTTRGVRGGLIAVVTLGVIVATETRAAILAVALVSVVVIAVSPRLRRIGAIWIFGPLLAALTVIFAPQLFADAWERTLSATDAGDRSRSSRTELWEGVVQATNAAGRTIDGLGAAEWIPAMQSQVASDVLVLGHAHSNFFQQWFRYGVVGAVLFLILAGALLLFALREYRTTQSPFALGGLAATVVFMVDSVFNNSLGSVNFVVLVFLLAGFAASPRSVRTGQPNDQPGERVR